MFDFESIWVKEDSYKVQGDRHYKVHREACSDISFSFVNFDPRTFFPLPYQSASSRLILYYCSRGTGNPKQDSDDIEVYWCWDSHQGKAVQNTGLTEPKTQTSRNTDGLCRWFFLRVWGTGPIYPIPANAKNQIFDLHEHFERVTIISCQPLRSTAQNMISI